MSDSELTDLTIGSFLRDKMLNMHQWLGDHGLVVSSDGLSDLTATLIAQELAAYTEAIAARDFEGLTGEKRVVEIVVFVRDRPELHDKFWRYLELFSNTVRDDE